MAPSTGPFRIMPGGPASAHAGPPILFKRTENDQNRAIMNAAQLLRNCRLFRVTPAKAEVSGDSEIHFDKRPGQSFTLPPEMPAFAGMTEI